MPALQYGSIPAERLGGAIVMRPFDLAGERQTQGTVIDRDTLLSHVRPANLRALIETHMLDPFPLTVVAAPGEAPASIGPVEYHKIHIGRGQHIVVRGEQVTPMPVDKDEADRIVANRGI